MAGRWKTLTYPPTLPAAGHPSQVVLVNQAFLFSGDSFTEYVVRPALVEQYDGKEDQGNDRHDCQSVLR